MWKVNRKMNYLSRHATNVVSVALTVIIDHSIAIHIGFFDHIIDFRFRQSLAQIGHDVTQFSWRYQSIVVFIENSIRFRNRKTWLNSVALPKNYKRVDYLKASLSSSSPSADFIFFDIISRNSLNSIVPLPLMSTSLTMLRNSFSVQTTQKRLFGVNLSDSTVHAYRLDAAPKIA